jgi:hypothetical protein
VSGGVETITHVLAAHGDAVLTELGVSPEDPPQQVAEQAVRRIEAAPHRALDRALAIAVPASRRYEGSLLA